MIVVRQYGDMVLNFDHINLVYINDNRITCEMEDKRELYLATYNDDRILEVFDEFINALGKVNVFRFPEE